uniref:Uncharacterized protein n=1 Tax=Zea mays TaxID=4577 RepID=B6UGZ6_MAIZE|nr:hypothetical protein [Zea mays]
MALLFKKSPTNITDLIIASLLVLLFIMASISPSFQVHVKGDDGHQHEGSLELAQQLRTTTCIAVKGGICFQKKCQGICESNGFNAATAFCYKPPGLHLPQCCCP